MDLKFYQEVVIYPHAMLATIYFTNGCIVPGRLVVQRVGLTTEGRLLMVIPLSILHRILWY